MEQVHGLQSGRESRQDVVQNDKISLGDIAPEGGWGGVYTYQKGVYTYHQPKKEWS